MAMVSCEECRAEISDSAWFCPKCGHVKGMFRVARGIVAIGQFAATRNN